MMGWLIIFRIIFKEFKISKIKSPKILILGATFKENISDIRNSKILEIGSVLKKGLQSLFL